MTTKKETLIIRQKTSYIGSVTVDKNEVMKTIYITDGQIGNNTYESFSDLILGLQGFEIKIDDFFY